MEINSGDVKGSMVHNIHCSCGYSWLMADSRPGEGSRPRLCIWFQVRNREVETENKLNHWLKGICSGCGLSIPTGVFSPAAPGRRHDCRGTPPCWQQQDTAAMVLGTRSTANDANQRQVNNRASSLNSIRHMWIPTTPKALLSISISATSYQRAWSCSHFSAWFAGWRRGSVHIRKTAISVAKSKPLWSFKTNLFRGHDVLKHLAMARKTAGILHAPRVAYSAHAQNSAWWRVGSCTQVLALIRSTLS